MKLISCDECATVLDADKLVFPDSVSDDGKKTGDIGAMWSTSKKKMVSIVLCPVCDAIIEKPE